MVHGRRVTIQGGTVVRNDQTKCYAPDKGSPERCITNPSNPKTTQFPPASTRPEGPRPPEGQARPERPEGAPPAFRSAEGGFQGGGFRGDRDGGDRGDRRGAPPAAGKHRVNREIRFPQIRVIGPDGDQLGILTPEEGRRIAAELGLDLVEVAPEARPPVCRIMDYGKYRYELSKKSKPQKTAKLKTLKLRPKTGDHDLDTKLNQARAFLKEGDRVRFVMRLRGRENAYVDRWCEGLAEDLNSLSDIGNLSVRPRAEGKAIVAQVDPK